MTYRTSPLAVAAIAVSVLTLCGCGAPATQQASSAAPPSAAPAAPSVPADHPPVSAGQTIPGHSSAEGGEATAMALPPVDPASGRGEAGLAWDVPASWVSEPPANTMRRAQYRVPGPGGDGECVVFYFGPGQGGDPRANAERWAAQFVGPDGSPAAAKTRELEANGVKILVIETKGTYLAGSMMGGPSEPRPGHALLGAVAAGVDANWFFKMTGPEATLEDQRKAFESLLGSIRRGA